jgi:uncharacterized FlaG/YvyC family protein
MYNLSQLNDMLVLELTDIADQFNISNSKELSRTDLINAILEKQTGTQQDKKDADTGDKPKRKRIVKELCTVMQNIFLQIKLLIKIARYSFYVSIIHREPESIIFNLS